MKCAVLTHSNAMICIRIPPARTASRRGSPTLRSMSPTPGRRRGGGLPIIACYSEGSHPTLTCAVLAHYNAMICLCRPHARMASRRGAPTLMSMSHTLGRCQGGGRPRISCYLEGSDPTLSCVVLAHYNAMICLCSPHALMASRRGATALMFMSPTLGRFQGVGLPRIACP